MAAKHKLENNEAEAISPNKREKSVVSQEEYYDNSSQQLQLQGSASYSQFYQQRGNWIAYYDWSTRHYYYMNIKTSETQWHAPEKWDRLPPVYNPWSQASTLSSDKTEDSVKSIEDKQEQPFKLDESERASKLAKYNKRPARRQADPDEKKKVHWIPEGATEYNIWYDRWVGEHWHKDSGGLDESETRCCLETDAGYTKANVLAQGKSKHYYCVYFAKGCCHLGSECGFLHGIPTQEDQGRIGLAQDCFGRDKHLGHKENMGGTGTFDREACTLYVGGLSLHSKLEELLWTEFGEWGEIEAIRIIPKKHIAFVRYKNRLNAEFAKVAMADQRLGNKDLLNVRWANEDPNPKAQIQDLKRVKGDLLQSMEDRGMLEELAAQPEIIKGEGATAKYPNTDGQYNQQFAITDHMYPSAAQEEQVSDTGGGIGPMTKQQIEGIQALDNAYYDCTRLDEALKRIEAIQGSGHSAGTTTTASLGSSGSLQPSTGDAPLDGNYTTEPETTPQTSETLYNNDHVCTGNSSSQHVGYYTPDHETTVVNMVNRTRDPYRVNTYSVNSAPVNSAPVIKDPYR